MGKIEMDVNKIKAAGSSIKGIAKEYNDVIETVFSKIQNLPNSGIWAGDKINSSVKSFVSNVMAEKKMYSDFGLTLNKLATRTSEYAKSVDNVSNTTI